MTADDRLTPLSLAVLLMGAGLCLWGSSALAAAAGQVQFVAGPVQLDRGGRSQAVVKGAQVEAGDVLRSGPTGQAQIRFTDGGIMALYPQSQISIGAYSDSAQAGSGEDRFAVRFVQGALRAVTGKIGQRNPQSYQVITPTAVVGIRGTAFKIFMNAEGEVEVSGEHNTIEVCTEAGCVEVKPREAVRVPSAEQLPVYIHTRGMLAMPLPRSSFQVGEQLLPDASYGAVRLEISPPSITPQNPNSGSPPVVAPPQVTNPVNPTTPIAPEPPTPVTPSNPVVPINPGGGAASDHYNNSSGSSATCYASATQSGRADQSSDSHQSRWWTATRCSHHSSRAHDTHDTHDHTDSANSSDPTNHSNHSNCSDRSCPPCTHPMIFGNAHQLTCRRIIVWFKQCGNGWQMPAKWPCY